MGSKLRKIHGRLPGRIASSDDINVIAFAELRFAHARAIKHACSYQRLLVRQIQPSVVHAGCAHCSARHNLGTVSEVADALAGNEFSPHALAQQEKLSADSASLVARALGKL